MSNYRGISKEAVLEYVRAHPGTTAAEMHNDIFAGRRSQRSTNHQVADMLHPPEMKKRPKAPSLKAGPAAMGQGVGLYTMDYPLKDHLDLVLSPGQVERLQQARDGAARSIRWCDHDEYITTHPGATASEEKAILRAKVDVLETIAHIFGVDLAPTQY